MRGCKDLSRSEEFESFVATVEPPLRRALVATYGFDLGREAAANALGWAWEHWERLVIVENLSPVPLQSGPEFNPFAEDSGDLRAVQRARTFGQNRLSDPLWPRFLSDNVSQSFWFMGSAGLCGRWLNSPALGVGSDPSSP